MMTDSVIIVRVLGNVRYTMAHGPTRQVVENVTMGEITYRLEEWDCEAYPPQPWLDQRVLEPPIALPHVPPLCALHTDPTTARLSIIDSNTGVVIVEDISIGQFLDAVNREQERDNGD